MRILFATFLILLPIAPGFSQSDSSLNRDAQYYYTHGEKAQAKSIVQSNLKEDSLNNTDLMLLARIYASEKKYDSATVYANKVHHAKSSSSEPLQLLSDIYYWQGKYEESKQFNNKLLEIKPNEVNAILRQAKLLDKTDSSFFALKTLYVKRALNDTTIQNRHKYLRIKLQRDKIYFRYEIDLFSEFYSHRQLYYLEYTHRTMFGSILPRVNIANRFNKTGNQYELDLYPKFNHNYYAYLNVGYSQSNIFPDYRFGAELNRKLPKSFTSSLGIRYLNFNPSRVLIYTGSIGKYHGNYWFSLRPFVVPKNDKIYGSLNFVARKYYKSALHYIAVEVGKGNSPDDQNFIANNDEFYKLRNFRTSFEFQKPINKTAQINIRSSWFRQEVNFGTKSFIYRTNFAIGIKQQF